MEKVPCECSSSALSTAQKELLCFRDSASWAPRVMELNTSSRETTGEVVPNVRRLASGYIGQSHNC